PCVFHCISVWWLINLNNCAVMWKSGLYPDNRIRYTPSHRPNTVRLLWNNRGWLIKKLSEVFRQLFGLLFH
ncbi:MAG: hypothetical protein RBR21_12240, partial [Bacteroidales bacterium]|nr:hypothetical protein [Bacteroidales bacterium]